ncbi:class F sortase [Modestobacter italicus]|uniref:class F sortase n=1 Tax=Modestobacter italicus (strain DSM 44449 / CECT 9708 / BC 501) TaxID=2732864 RepID=UPI001C97EAD6|nr:class F sortase [Modestobacter italicus]
MTRPSSQERSGRHRRPDRSWLTAVRGGLLAVAVVAGTVALVDRPDDAVRATASASPPAPVVLGSPTAVPAARAVATPAGLRIDAIGLDTDLTRIGVDDAGALVPPADFEQAGWFAAGPAPGEVGPAVLAGHVDDRRGPGVFSRLEELEPGDRVQVTRSDGQVLQFAVTRVAAYPKDDFATAEVYGPTTGAELRLITCGGSFDRTRRSYTDNVVVYARLT